MSVFKQASYLGAIVVGLGFAATASAAPVYFTDNFSKFTPAQVASSVDRYPMGEKQGDGSAVLKVASTDANLTLVATGGQQWGGARVFTTPSDLFLGKGFDTLLNVSGSSVGTKNSFSSAYVDGGYVYHTVFTANQPAPAVPALDTAMNWPGGAMMDIYLRQSALGARDGLKIYLSADGYIARYEGATESYKGTIGVQSTLAPLFVAPSGFDLKVIDTGTDVSLFVNDVNIGSFSSSFGNTNAGYIQTGTAGYVGTKYGIIEVTAVPEPGMIALVGVMGLMLARRRASAV